MIGLKDSVELRERVWCFHIVDLLRGLLVWVKYQM